MSSSHLEMIYDIRKNCDTKYVSKYFSRNHMQMANFTADFDKVLICQSTYIVICKRDGTVIGVLEGHTNTVRSARCSPDNKFIVSASADCTVRLWSLSDYTCVRVFEGHDDGVNDANFSHDNTMIVSAGSDNKVLLWTIDNGECTKLHFHTDEVLHAQFSPDDATIVSCGYDYNVCIWSTHTQELLQKSILPKVIYSINHYGDKLLLSYGGARNGLLQILHLEDGLIVFDSPESHCECYHRCDYAEYSPDRAYILCVSGHFIKIIDAVSLRCILPIELREGVFHYATFGSSSKTILTVSSDKIVRCFHVDI